MTKECHNDIVLVYFSCIITTFYKNVPSYLRVLFLKYVFCLESEWKLLLVKQQELVGQLPGGADVFKINKIAILPLCLEEAKDLDIEVRNFAHLSYLI